MTCSLVLQKKKNLTQNSQHSCNTFNQSSLNWQVKKIKYESKRRIPNHAKSAVVLAENGGNTTGSGLKKPDRQTNLPKEILSWVKSTISVYAKIRERIKIIR